jgi:hypothetical protein
VAAVELNIKNIVILMGLLGTLIGNVFFVGKLYNEFELLKDDVLKQELLELKYKIKSLRLEIDGDYRE